MSTKCGAQAKSTGRPCGRPAGWGTDHLGFGNCKLHGGSSPGGRDHGRRLAAEHAVLTYGLPREIEPHQALLEELYRTAGHVSWLGDLISRLERGELKQYGGDEDGYLWEKPAIWVELYHRERKHFAAVAKTCVDVGIEERRVRIAEQTGHLFAEAIRGILAELGVMDRPETPAIVRRHLTLMAGRELEGGGAVAVPTDNGRTP